MIKAYLIESGLDTWLLLIPHREPIHWEVVSPKRSGTNIKQKLQIYMFLNIS